MARFAILILVLFLYVGVGFLFNTAVTGTTTGEAVANTIFPILLAIVAIGTLWRIFK